MSPSLPITGFATSTGKKLPVLELRHVADPRQTSRGIKGLLIDTTSIPHPPLVILLWSMVPLGYNLLNHQFRNVTFDQVSVPYRICQSALEKHYRYLNFDMSRIDDELL